ncbi:MAG: regulatory protein RecX [Bacillota bacterium]|nr:regulatory protein RecX [Bacillota bacterium]
MTDAVLEIKKRPGCKLVSLKGGEQIKVPNALFRLYTLKVNDPIDPDNYRLLLKKSEARYALETAVRILELRDKSRDEIMNKLLDAGYSEQAAQAACDKLESAGYLNDRRYAANTLERLNKKYGAIRLKQELRQRGIGEDLIEELLLDTDKDAQAEAAVRLAQKTLRGKTGEKRDLYRRAYAALARRGYTPDVVKSALQQVFSDAPDDL